MAVKRPLPAVRLGNAPNGDFTFWMNYMACDVPTSRVKIEAVRRVLAPELTHFACAGRR